MSSGAEDDASMALEAIRRGCTWFKYGYDANKKLSKERIHIFYEASPTGQDSGCLYYCSPGERVKSEGKSLPLNLLTDVYLQKQTEIFLSDFAKEAVDENCLSLISQSTTWDIEAEDSAERELWLQGIGHLLQAEGKTVVVSDEGEEDKGQPNEVGIMLQGTNLWSYKSVDGKVTRSPRKLVLVMTDVSSNGVINLCLVDGTVEDSLPIDEITDVFTGKQTASLESSIASHKGDEVFFSLISPSKIFDLETNHKDVVTAWINGISHVLARSGKDVILGDEDDNATANTPGASRFGIVMSDANQTSPKSDTSEVLMLSAEEIFKIMESGGTFRMHSKDANGKASKKEVKVKYQKDSDELAWFSVVKGKEGNQEGSVALNTIKDVYLGKQGAVFKSSEAKKAKDELCVSILSDNGSSLDLEALTQEQMVAWLRGLDALLVSKGDSIVVESTSDEQPACRRFSIDRSGSSLPGASLAPATQNTFSMLSAGGEFQLYSNDTGRPARKDVSVFVEEGTLYWCAPGKRVKDESSSIDLGTITDVYLGKQTPIMKSSFASSAKEEACFSLIAESNVSGHVELNLECDSTEQLLAWMWGLNLLFTEAGKTVSMEDEVTQESAPSPTSQKRRFSVAGSHLSSSSLTMSIEATVDMLSAGRNFKRYWEDGNGKVLEETVFLFCRNDAGRFWFYWCAPGTRNEDPDRSFCLDTITDIFLGKQSKVLASKQDLDDDRCMSIVSPTAQYHFEAEGTDILTAWLQAISTVLSNAGKEIINETAPEKPRRMSVVQRSKGKAADPCVKTMQIGSLFTLYENPKKPVKRDIKLFFVEDGTRSGSLFWCDADRDNEQNSEMCISLHDLTDIFVGKMEGIFTNPVAKEAKEDHCLALKSKKKSLYLEAAKPGLVSLWVQGLSVCFSATGKKLVLEEEKAAPTKTNPGYKSRRMSVTAYKARAKRAGSTDSVQSTVPADTTMAMMMEGRSFTSFYSDGSSCKVTLFYKQTDDGKGELCWTNNSSLTPTPAETISLANLEEVFLGKQTPGFATAAGQAAVASRCFSLVGTSNVGQKLQVNLQADVPEVLSAWLLGINTVLGNSGKKVMAESVVASHRGSRAAQTMEKSRRKFTVMKVDDMTAAPKIQLTNVQKIEAGTEAKLYMKPSAPKPDNIFLWYTKERSELGYIYWAPSQSRNADPDQCLDLSDLKEIFGGKQTKIFNSRVAVEAAEEHCLSFITKAGGEINVEFANVDEIDAWIEGLSTILSQNGKKIVEDPSAGKEATPNPAKGSISNHTRTDRSNSRRRFSILALEQRSKEAQVGPSIFSSIRPQETMEQMTVKRPTIQSLPATPVVKMMMHGSIFTGYAENRKGKFVKKHLLVFFNPKHGRHGTLYWCPPGHRIESRNCSLNLKDITDIFLGKRTDVFESVGAANAVPEHCFTIMSKTKAIDLEAKSAEDLNLWLFGINSILTGDAKKTLIQGDVEYDESLGVTSTPGPVTQHRRRLSMLAKQHERNVGGYDKPAGEQGEVQQIHNMQATVLARDYKATVRMMEQGRIFAEYSLYEDKKHYLVFYDAPTPQTKATVGPLGALYWCAPEHPVKSINAMLPLHEVTELVIGKQTKAFRNSLHAEKADENCCVSLIGEGGKEVNLEARNTEQLVAFLWGLNSILATSGKTVGRAEAVGTNVPRFTVYDADKTPADAANGATEERQETFLSLPFAEIVAMMIKGGNFTAYVEGGSPGHVIKRSIFLFYSPTDGKAGTFFWCEPGKREIDPRRRLPLSEVTDIFLGKQTAVLENEAAQNAPEDRCFSIITPRTSLHLSGESGEQVTAWLYSLDTVLSSSGKKFVLDADAMQDETNEPQPRRFTVVNQSTAVLPRSKVPVQQTESAAVKEMTNGCDLVSYENASNPIRRPLFFFYQPAVGKYGSIFWCERGERVESPSNCIPLHTVTDVFIGKQTKIFETEFAKHAVENRCFSIIGAEDIINVEAPTPSIVSTWLAGVKHILESAGLAMQLKEQKDTYTPGFSTRRFSVMMGLSSLPQLTANKVIQMMVQGTEVITYTKSGDKVVATMSTIFYERKGNLLGSIYWCAAGKREKIATNSLPLHRLRTIFLTKQTDVLLSAEAADAPEDSCFALVGKKESLHVNCGDARVLKDWITGINHVLTNAGKRIAIEEDTPLEDSQPEVSGDSNVSRQRLGVISSTTAASSNNGSHYITMMLAGRILNRHSTVGAENTASSDFVFFAADGTKFGSLYWCAANERVEHPERCLPFESITRIVAGKQKDYFTSESLDHHCLSLIGQSRELHLQMESLQQRDAWLEGVKAILNTCGRKLDQSGKHPLQFTVTSPSFTSTAVAKITAGDTFTSFEDPDGACTKNDIRIFFDATDAKCGALYWHEASEPVQKLPEHRLALHEISDIYVGKQRRVFQMAFAADSQEDCCLSVVGKHSVIDVQASSAQQVQVWVGAITHILTAHGQQVCLEEETPCQAPDGASYTRRRFSVAPYVHPATLGGGASARPASEHPDFMTVANNETVAMMEKGRIFEVVFKIGKSIVIQRCRLWYSASQGALFWCPPEKHSDTSGPMLLTALTDIFLGKQSAVLKTKEALGIDENLAFTLVAAKEEWSFVAPHEEQLNAWLVGIHSLLEGAGKTAVVQDEKRTRNFSIQDESTATPNTAATTTTTTTKATTTATSVSVPSRTNTGTLSSATAATKLEASAAVRAMMAGTDFISYEDVKHPRTEAVTVFFVADSSRCGSIYWCPAGNSRVQSPDRRLPLHLLSDIYLGKHSELLNSPLAASAKEEECFSLVGKSTELHLQAAAEQVEEWAEGLNYILSHTGNNIVEQEHVDESDQGCKRITITPAQRSTLDTQRKTTLMDTSYKGTLSIMEAGRTFTGFFINADGTLLKRDLNVFYTRSDSPIETGALWWCDAGKQVQNEEECLPISEIDELFLGKQTSEFELPGTEDVDDKLCISLIGKRATINLQAATKDMLRTWTMGLTGLLQTSGKQVLLQETLEELTSAGKRKETRRFSVVEEDSPWDTAMLEASSNLTNITGDHPSPSDCLRLMKQGTDFTYYRSAGSVAITLFFDPSVGPNGSICWATRGSRVVKASMDISDLTDIYVGRQTKIFQQPIAVNANEDYCLSLASSSLSLDLEAVHEAELNAWLAGLEYLLTISGRQVLEKEEQSDLRGEASSSSNRKPSRRFSIA